jgi:hypothetical protein
LEPSIACASIKRPRSFAGSTAAVRPLRILASAVFAASSHVRLRHQGSRVIAIAGWRRALRDERCRGRQSEHGGGDRKLVVEECLEHISTSPL